jgi:hypothetical protein
MFILSLAITKIALLRVIIMDLFALLGIDRNCSQSEFEQFRRDFDFTRADLVSVKKILRICII